MEDRLWEIVVQFVPEDKSPSSFVYSSREIVAVILWAVLHDRPMCWACQAENWPSERRPARIPDPSTISRRSRTPEFLAAREATQASLAERLGEPTQAAAIDGQPYRISDYSRDPDARNGRAYRRFGRGYKLHAVIDGRGVVLRHEVRSLNEQERVAAKRLLPSLAPRVRRVFADGNYDSGPIHDCLKGTGRKFYCPLIKNYVSPDGHPRRKVVHRIMNHPLGERIRVAREHIERQFARMTNLGFGLKGLPNWARRLHRVERWISHKILLHHAYLLLRAQTA